MLLHLRRLDLSGILRLVYLAARSLFALRHLSSKRHSCYLLPPRAPCIRCLGGLRYSLMVSGGKPIRPLALLPFSFESCTSKTSIVPARQNLHNTVNL